ncbi:hypothetical protein M569_12623, partial [Genlisea aurea]
RVVARIVGSARELVSEIFRKCSGQGSKHCFWRRKREGQSKRFFFRGLDEAADHNSASNLSCGCW